MRPHIEAGTVTGIELEDAIDVKVLKSYFTGDQPETFNNEAVATRLIELQRRLDESLDTSTFPVLVETADVTDLAVPAVNLAINELYAMGRSELVEYYATKPLIDFRYELTSALS